MSSGKIDIYSASAGSGKTFRLTGEYIKMLFLNELEYKHILAVTFTNKATAEMKQRILNELYTLSNEPAKSPYLQEIKNSTKKNEAQIKEYAGKIMIKILHDYSAFNISTIDTFFQSVMRSFSREMGKMANYNVELSDKSVIAMVVDKIYSELDKKESEKLLNWLISYSLERIAEGKSWRIRGSIEELSAYLHNENFKIKSRGKIDLENSGSYITEVDRLKKAAQKVENEYISKTKAEAEAILSRFTGAGIVIREDFAGKSKSPFLVLEKLAAGAALTPDLYEKLLKIGDNVDDWFPKKRDAIKHAAVKAMYTEILAPLTRLQTIYKTDGKNYFTYKVASRNLSAMAVLGVVYRNLLQYCKENNMLLLSQTNELLTDIIDGSDAPFIYEKVGSWIDHFMIDEFQDTSLMQWQNFKPLLENSLGQGFENLVVGDIKQSIYRWRNSDWRVLGSGIKADFKNKYNINNLSVNWRSSKDIIEFNNAFFTSAALFLNNLYNKNVNGRVRTILDVYNYKGNSKNGAPAADFADQSASEKGAQLPGYVEVNFIEKDSEATLTEQILVSTVERLVASGYPKNRIAVLVRTNKDAGKAAKALTDNGFDVTSSDAFQLGSSNAVHEIISYLTDLDGDFGVQKSEYLQMPLYKLCETLIREHLKKEFKEDLLFLQSFLDTVLNFTIKEGDNRTAFLNWWNDKGKETNLQITQEQEAISVMSIHKSKGLEFDAVILPYFELSLTPQGNKRPLLWSDSAASILNYNGILAVRYDSLLGESDFRADYTEEMLYSYIDSMNLAYVAFTRPKRELIIISGRSKDLDNGKKEVTTIANYLQLYVKNNMTHKGDGCYYLGTQTSCQQKKEEDNSLVIEPPTQFGLPIDDGRLKLALQNREIGDDSTIRNLGIIMHGYFEQIERESDADKITEPDIKSYIKEKLSFVAEREWFSGKYKVNRECSIIDLNGDIFRPDRVLTLDGKAVVIDYKFGEYVENEPHYTKQVRRYMKLLRQMGYSEVSGYLWYVNHNKVEECG